MPRAREGHLSLKCGFAADMSDGMLWLEQKGANLTAGISADNSSELLYDEEDGMMSVSAVGHFFLSMPATKAQAENLAKMIGAEVDFVEKLDSLADAELTELVRKDIEELGKHAIVSPK